ncbi:MAG: hypothetical protein A2Y38_26045 [Spirochaetes bacterium GWB1_59_5]|nr:MAG: hypothetical protein A2Y38_26045 [Spirochaetes bacterium GWB1_59_5]
MGAVTQSRQAIENTIYRAMQIAIGLAIIGVATYCSSIGGTASVEDEQEYLAIANSIASGDGYMLDGQPTAYRPPTWPLLFVPFIAIGLPAKALAIIPALCLIAAGWCAAKLGVRLIGSRYGIVAGLIVLAYPLNVFTAGTFYPQTLAVALVLGMWLLAARIDGRPAAWAEAAGLGMLGALMALAVPTLIFTSVAVLWWVMWRQHVARLRFLVVAGAAFTAPIALWTLRNLAAFGSIIPFSTSSGINLLLGNNPNATPASGVSVDLSTYYQAAKPLGKDEVARSSFFQSSAIDWIATHPADAAALYAGKLVNYFSAYNTPAAVDAGSILHALIAWGSFIAVVVLCLFRLAYARRAAIPVQASEKFFLALFLLNGPVMAVFFTRARFRQPLDAVLLVEAAIGIIALAAILLSRRNAKSA